MSGQPIGLDAELKSNGMYKDVDFVVKSIFAVTFLSLFCGLFLEVEMETVKRQTKFMKREFICCSQNI